MTNIYVVKSDKLYDLNFTLNDSTGTPIDLTGATITIDVQQVGATALAFTGSMSAISVLAGTCKYTVQPTDFNLVAQYYAEIEVSYPSGKRISFADILINVQSDLPK